MTRTTDKQQARRRAAIEHARRVLKTYGSDCGCGKDRAADALEIERLTGLLDSVTIGRRDFRRIYIEARRENEGLRDAVSLIESTLTHPRPSSAPDTALVYATAALAATKEGE